MKKINSNFIVFLKDSLFPTRHYLDMRNHKVSEMILRTASGQELQRYNETKKALDISYLPNGIYFLEFNLENGETATKKFTKM